MSAYLDHAATTPIRPEAKTAYVKTIDLIGNPSAIHQFGQSARRLVEEAREELAKAIGATRNEIIFTSGGTEGDNLAIKGIFWSRIAEDSKRKIIVSAQTEHHAVIDTVDWLTRHQGAEVHWVKLDEHGVIDLSALAEFVGENHERIALISLMWANNETGVVTDISAITALARPFDIPVHSDAVAAFGHIPINFQESGLSALTFTGHKIGAPVGIGALVVARGLKIAALQHGGGHELGYRSGTLDAAGASAFAAAASVTIATLSEKSTRLITLRDRIISSVLAIAPDARLSRGDAPALPDNAHFTFPGCSGDSLLFLLDQAGVAVSNGSACQAGVAQGSHVLMAMGRSEAEAASALRITLGWCTTSGEVDQFLAALPVAYQGAKKAGYTV